MGENNYSIIDTHGHYVFGVDDGARDIGMSLDMVRQAWEQGVSDIICTSHSWADMSSYDDRLAILRERLLSENIPVHLHAGMEIECSEWMLPMIIEDLKTGRLHSMGNSDHVLLEFSPRGRGDEILRCVERITELPSHGGAVWKPVIAHAERYRAVQNDPSVVDRLKAWNIPIQINAYSLVEEKDDAIRSCARRLLEDELVTFIGSDAHRTDHRSPNIRSGIAYIYENCSREYADGVCRENARRLLLMK